MNTGCTSLDSAKARTELEKSFSDSGLFERTLVDCFVDGSRAAAETASHFLRNQATSQSAAEYISNGIKSLPTAVASTNAPPLAAVAAFIALGFDGQVCNAPLRSFCFSNHEVKRAAIEAVIRILSLKLSLSGGDCDSLLQKAAKFFGDVSAELSEVELSFMVREITGITSHAYEENQGQLLSLLLDLGAGNSPCLEQGSSHRLSTRFESFYAVELANSAFDLESITAVVLHCLCRGIEFGDASAIRAVWKSHKDWVIEVFESTHCDMFLAALCTIAGQQAWQGNIEFCQDVLDALRQALNCVMSTSSKVSEVIVLFVSGICVSIGSIGMAAGAEELAKNCASIIRLANDSSSGNACPAEECLDGMSQAVFESVKRKWPVSSLVFAVLRKLLLVWKYPSFTEAWLKEDFVVLLESRTKLYVKEDLQYGVVDSLSKVENAENLMPVGRTVLRASAEPVALPIVGTLITLMSHKHPRVRLSSLELLQKVRKSSLLVFFLPSIMVLMEKESNGFIAAKYLREVLTCPGFMSRTETSNVVLSTLLRLSGAHINSETHGIVLTALAQASEYAPSVSLPLLTGLLERLKSSFDSTRAQIRVAASAAILRLAEVRPSRCTGFIPFISLCITPKSAEVAAQATSLCFDAMYVMAKEGVLDAVKAVKVVLKSFSVVTTVSAQARRSYLRLLGVIAGGQRNKKSLKVVQVVIAMLRQTLTHLNPSSTQSSSKGSTNYLSWEDIQQAASSLSQFSVDEILRVAFADEEPLANMEEEKKRLERIDSDSAQFVREVIIAAGHTRAGGNSASRHIQELVEKIVEHEWKIRRKSSFDPERIGKLRATTEALRRARKTQGLIDDSEDDAHGHARSTFLRATRSFPTGVLRTVFELCVLDRENAQKNDSIAMSICGISMSALANTKILTPALPWAAMINETISQTSDTFARSICFLVLRSIRDDNFEIKEKQNMWFGPQSPLFDDETNLPLGEAAELFIGMAELFPSDLERLLRTRYKIISNELLKEFTRACAQLDSEGNALKVAVDALFKPVCDRERSCDDHARQELEQIYVTAGLKRCEANVTMSLISRADHSNPSVIRLSCLYGTHQTVNIAVQGLLSRTVNTQDARLNGTAGRAVRLLPFSHRRDILLKLFGDRSVGSNERALEGSIEIAAHALTVGALLPAGNGVLYATLSGSEKKEQRMILSLLTYISSAINKDP